MMRPNRTVKSFILVFISFYLTAGQVASAASTTPYLDSFDNSSAYEMSNNVVLETDNRGNTVAKLNSGAVTTLRTDPPFTNNKELLTGTSELQPTLRVLSNRPAGATAAWSFDDADNVQVYSDLDGVYAAIGGSGPRVAGAVGYA